MPKLIYSAATASRLTASHFALVSGLVDDCLRESWWPLGGPTLYFDLEENGSLHVTLRGIELPHRLHPRRLFGWLSKAPPQTEGNGPHAHDSEAEARKARMIGVAADHQPAADPVLHRMVNPLTEANTTEASRKHRPVGPARRNAGDKRRPGDASESVPPVQVLADAGDAHAATPPRSAKPRKPRRTGKAMETAQ